MSANKQTPGRQAFRRRYYLGRYTEDQLFTLVSHMPMSMKLHSVVPKMGTSEFIAILERIGDEVTETDAQVLNQATRPPV